MLFLNRYKRITHEYDDSGFKTDGSQDSKTIYWCEDLLLVQNTLGYYGFIDKTGKEVIGCRFDEANDFSEGLAAVKLGNKWLYIDKIGKVKIDTFNYEMVGNFKNGLAVVVDKRNHRYGYINKAGIEVIPCQYELALSFSCGLAVIKQNEKYSYIDKKGDIVVFRDLDMAKSFCGGIARVVTHDKFYFICIDGCIYDKITGHIKDISWYGGMSRINQFGDLHDELILCRCFGDDYFVDLCGNSELSLPRGMYYYGVGEFYDGLAHVGTKNKKFGFIDKSGKEVIPCIYEDVFDFYNGVAMIDKNGQYGFVDRHGNEYFILKETDRDVYEYVDFFNKKHYIDKYDKYMDDIVS